MRAELVFFPLGITTWAGGRYDFYALVFLVLMLMRGSINLGVAMRSIPKSFSSLLLVDVDGFQRWRSGYLVYMLVLI